eukprot:TCONS_00042238-protein
MSNQCDAENLKTTVLHSPWDPSPSGKFAQNFVSVGKIPYNFSPTGKLSLILSPLEIQRKKLLSDAIPAGTFGLTNNRISIPIGISIEIFILTENKTSTGAV